MSHLLCLVLCGKNVDDGALADDPLHEMRRILKQLVQRKQTRLKEKVPWDEMVLVVKVKRV